MESKANVIGASMHPIVMRLRELSTGKDVWRVCDKDTGAYCIEFESWEQLEAIQWWNARKGQDFHQNHELKRVRTFSEEDRLMQKAADMLEIYQNMFCIMGHNVQIP